MYKTFKDLVRDVKVAVKKDQALIKNLYTKQLGVSDEWLRTVWVNFLGEYNLGVVGFLKPAMCQDGAPAVWVEDLVNNRVLLCRLADLTFTHEMRGYLTFKDELSGVSVWADFISFRSLENVAQFIEDVKNTGMTLEEFYNSYMKASRDTECAYYKTFEDVREDIIRMAGNTKGKDHVSEIFKGDDYRAFTLRHTYDQNLDQIVCFEVSSKGIVTIHDTILGVFDTPIDSLEVSLTEKGISFEGE